ncbi:MAG: glycogen debranching protein [Fusobacteriaceae bacterium]
MYIIRRGECKLGSVVKKNGVNFGIYSRSSKEMLLNIFSDEISERPIFSYKLISNENRTGDVWHVFIEGLKENMFYTWNVYRDDSTKSKKKHHIIDPYSKAYTEKKAVGFQKAVIINDDFLNREIKRPNILLEDTIIYEMHISLFTKSSTSKVEFPGSYKGIIEKIEYLKQLGVTTVEILPIFEFDDFVMGKSPETKEPLKNIWGYNPIGFFAVTSKYYSEVNNIKGKYEGPLKEFKELVDVLHKNGIEIILDVVYNHTAEGNEKGNSLNFKEMDKEIFYLFDKKTGEYLNYSGTGNTMNCNHPVVKSMIIDSLRYWYCKVGVDGFRFDLGAIMGRGETGEWLGSKNSLLNDISNDIILSKAKIMTEPWDAGNGYFMDDFPKNWSVWNGKFRDATRKFIKGDSGIVNELIQRVTGSFDIFKNSEKNSLNSLNFITAHDGFTMFDLVSYNKKNNQGNGENNRDGENNNNSWNHGLEGETSSDKVNKLRIKQMKNLITLLLISRGIPMILMGDELGKTQNGNNNSYCQDNEINWLDWKRAEKYFEITYFFRKMIKFRKIHKGLKEKKHYTRLGEITIHGVKAWTPDLSYDSHSIAFMFEYEKNAEIYVAFNSYFENLEFELPVIHGKEWHVVSDTEKQGKESFLERTLVIFNGKYNVSGRSSAIFIAKNKKITT